MNDKFVIQNSLYRITRFTSVDFFLSSSCIKRIYFILVLVNQNQSDPTPWTHTLPTEILTEMWER